MLDGGETFGGLDEARQGGGLVEREVACMNPEIEEGRLFNPVVSVTEIDVVEVDGEDFVFGQGLLDLTGEHGLLEFSGHAAFGGEDQVFDDLLRYGRSALARAAILDGHQHGARDADIVKPLVVIEIGILGRNHGFFHFVGNVLERNDRAPFVIKLQKRNPVTVEDDRHFLGGIVAVGKNPRQRTRVMPEHEGDNGAAEKRRHDKYEYDRAYHAPSQGTPFGSAFARLFFTPRAATCLFFCLFFLFCHACHP